MAIKNNFIEVNSKFQETRKSIKLPEYNLADKMIKLLSSPYLRQFGKNGRNRYSKLTICKDL